MSTFQRNAIIAGYINSYCLVCECFFETDEQTFNHTKTEEHENKLQAYPFLEKFGNNGIRKVKAGYFCGYCSILMATAAKVNLHIADKMHYYNKGDTLLKHCGDYLTAFDDVLISETAWHCIADDACAMCNAEFDDGDEHKTERAHLIKLMQNKVEFGNDNSLYRRIDKNYFQCLTCNSVLPMSNLDDHFDEETHKLKYIQCQEDKKKYDLANPKVTVNNETKKIKTDNTSDTKNEILIVDKEMSTVTGTVNTTEISSSKDVKINKGIQKIIDNNINTVAGMVNTTEISLTKDVKVNSKIDDKMNTIAGNINATEGVKVDNTIETKAKPQENSASKQAESAEKKENKSQETKTETKVKVKDIKIVKVNPKVVSTDPAIYAADNTVAYDPRNPIAICKTCVKRLPSNFRALKEHINGRYHTNKCKRKPKPSPKKDNLTRRALEDFVIKIQDCNNGYTVINGRICVSGMSFHGITKANDGKFMCQMCDMALSVCDISKHWKTWMHERAMRLAMVVTTWKDDFIREVRLGVFHCGFCNVVLPAGGEALSSHHRSMEHIGAVVGNKRRVQRVPFTCQSITRPHIVEQVFFNMVVKHMEL